MPRIWKRRNELDRYHRDKEGNIRGDRPFTKLLYHLNISMKYRRDFSKCPSLINDLGKIITDICEYNNWPLIALAVQGNHIHIFLQLPPSVSISDVMRIIKSNSSKQIREKYPILKTSLHKSSFWSRKYSAFSVGSEDNKGRDEENVRRYIEKQRLQRWDRSLCGGREPTRL